MCSECLLIYFSVPLLVDSTLFAVYFMVAFGVLASDSRYKGQWHRSPSGIIVEPGRQSPICFPGWHWEGHPVDKILDPNPLLGKSTHLTRIYLENN